MFWPLLNNKVDPGPYQWLPTRSETQSLNEAATRGDLDICAVSFATYPRIQDRYLMLPHGGSVGRGYGPVVVVTPEKADEIRLNRGSASLEEQIACLQNRRIGIPGTGTTAYLVLRSLVEKFEPINVPISPYSRAFEALRSQQVDAALLIHEGRLTYEKEGMVRVLELGEAWNKRWGLPLPLGGNVIKRSLGKEVITDVSARIRASIRWAVEHRDEMIESLLKEETRSDIPISRALLDRYLQMYANDDTIGYDQQTQKAAEKLIEEGRRIGVYDHLAKMEWSD